MKKQFHWRATALNLSYLREFAEAQGGSRNGTLNAIVGLLRQHNICSLADLARSLPPKKDGTKVVSNG